MCIFISASCIYASDIDDVANNNTGAIDVSSLADEGSESLTSDLDDHTGDYANDIDAISGDAQHYKIHEKIINGKKANLHHKVGHNGTGCKKHHNKDHENSTDGNEAKLDYNLLNKPHYEKIQIDGRLVEFSDDLQGGDVQMNNVSEKGDLPNFIDITEHTSNKNCEKTITDNIAKTWISGSAINNQMFLKFTNLHKKAMGVDSKLVKEEFCCCKDGNCNHNLNTNIHNHDKISIAKNINNDDELAYSYNHNVKIYNSKASIICFRVSNEEEIIDARNRNFKNVLIINYNNRQDDENDIKDCNAILDMNASELAINFTDFDHGGLELSLNCDELNIKDYNLEYYIFTNPYIIINSFNVEKVLFNNNIENHCFNTIKAKHTIAPTINYNHSPFDDSITHDNYDLSDYNLTTTFYDTTSVIEVSALNFIAGKALYSIGKLSLKLSNEMLAAIIISGDMKNV